MSDNRRLDEVGLKHLFKKILTYLNSKIDKVTDANNGDIAVFNSSGGLEDSLVSLEEGTELNVVESLIDSNQAIPTSKAVKDVTDVKENTSNKTNTLNSESTQQQYPNAQVTYNAIENVREVAAGKTKNYVCSDVTNPILNSQDASITLTSALIDIKGNTIALADLKIGDNIYIIQTDVPDRWVSIEDTIVTLNKLETAKVPVADIQINGTTIVDEFGIAHIPYAYADKAGIIKTNTNTAFNTNPSSHYPIAMSKTYQEYLDGWGVMFIGKDTLEAVITGKDLQSGSQVDTKIANTVLSLTNQEIDTIWEAN